MSSVSQNWCIICNYCAKLISIRGQKKPQPITIHISLFTGLYLCIWNFSWHNFLACMTALRLNHNIPNSSFLDSEQVTVDSNEDFGQRFRQQILFVGGPNFIIDTWDDTACLEQHYQTQPQNNLCVFGCWGWRGLWWGCDDVRMSVENHYSIGKTLL